MRKIDLNDGEMSPSVPLKKGFAAGQPVSYWDFGVAKRSSAPAYGIAADCSGDARVAKDGYPIIVDNIPGDGDYSAYRGILWACPIKLAGEVISSLDAFNDAIDLGLISDPTSVAAPRWYNQPIVNKDVALAFTNGVLQPREAYYKRQRVFYHDLTPQEGSFPIDPKLPLTTGNVYELVKPGSMVPSRVIFSQPFANPDGSLNPDGSPTRNPLYSPSWIVVTLTLKAQTVPPGGDAAAALDALIATLNNAENLVMVGMNNTVTINPLMTGAIASATVTTNRVNRAFLISDVVP